MKYYTGNYVIKTYKMSDTNYLNEICLLNIEFCLMNKPDSIINPCCGFIKGFKWYSKKYKALYNEDHEEIVYYCGNIHGTLKEFPSNKEWRRYCKLLAFL